MLELPDFASFAIGLLVGVFIAVPAMILLFAPNKDEGNSHDQAELQALRRFVREVAQQDPAQVPGQRQSNKERAEDLCEQWGITA